jgi:drug/metabolite transporter (DMT)-like permease
MPDRYKGPLLIAASAIMWSSAGVLIKLVPWNAMSIVGLRSLFAAAVLLIYMRRPRISFTKPVILGGLSLSATMVLFVFANKLTTAANAIVLQYTSPIFVILLSPLLLKSRSKALDIATVGVVFAGVALFFFGQMRTDAVLGSILGVLSGFTCAMAFIAYRMPGAKPVESMLLAFLVNIFAGAPFVAIGVTFEAVPWLVVALLGVFQLGLPYVIFSIGIRRTPPLTACLVCALEPLLNPVWVMIATGEKPGVYALIGGILVIAAVAAYNVLSVRQARRELPLPPHAGDAGI